MAGAGCAGCGVIGDYGGFIVDGGPVWAVDKLQTLQNDALRIVERIRDPREAHVHDLHRQNHTTYLKLSGAVLLGVGIWLLVDPRIVNVFDVFSAIGSEGDLLRYAAFVLSGVGCFVFVVGFFGCCGAIKQSKCLLGVYILLLVIVMGLEVAVGVLAIVFKDKISMTIEDKLDTAFSNNYNGSNSKALAFTEGLNYVQAHLQCCGISGPSSYTDDLQGFTGEYPVSCCVLNRFVDITALVPDDAEDYDKCKEQLATDVSENCVQAYHEGCIKPLQAWINSNARVLIGIGIGIACLEIFGFICAVCLCCSIRKDF